MSTQICQHQPLILYKINNWLISVSSFSVLYCDAAVLLIVDSKATTSPSRTKEQQPTLCVSSEPNMKWLVLRREIKPPAFDFPTFPFCHCQCVKLNYFLLLSSSSSVIVWQFINIKGNCWDSSFLLLSANTRAPEKQSETKRLLLLETRMEKRFIGYPGTVNWMVIMGMELPMRWFDWLTASLRCASLGADDVWVLDVI